ncbi:MAG: S1 family peptidase [Acholeplasmatales bacterium]
MFQKAASILEKNLYGIFSTTKSLESDTFKWNMGTGFAVNDTDILTAAHNLYIDNNPNNIHSKIEVIEHGQLSSGGTMKLASIIFIDSHNDLAVLRITRTTGEATFRNAPCKVGESCAFIGYPNSYLENNQTVFFRGVLKAGVITKIEPNHIFIDRTLFPGSSGGPIFDINGNVLGIANKYVTDNSNQFPVEISFGKDASTIINVLTNEGILIKTV